jgi:hypothetical protein
MDSEAGHFCKWLRGLLRRLEATGFMIAASMSSPDPAS